ncbi:aspartyl protease AED1-like [Mangifera indica]|uniref:aspartyl protease AED1-like n=1 Tax=Mangifera indica TaxID=29780 RepID=UPI001CFB0075|nr:aspartyl protease AED1-like [Mangifera indica]
MGCFMANFCRLLCFCFLFFSFVFGARELAVADDRQHAEEMNSLLPASKSFPNFTNEGSRSQLGQDQSKGRSVFSLPFEGPKLSLQKKPIGDDNYVVTVGFGTPKRDLTLMFDTGSSTTWIQCKPCMNCYDQEDPIFDPSQSSTFSNSSHPYTQNYHDKSYASGYFAYDTLTMATYEFKDFTFLCGHNNSGLFGAVAGVLGIGLSNDSLISQTSGNFLRLFCYCLPPTEASSGFLAFGITAALTCLPRISTPLISDPDGFNRYFVNLVGITIGQRTLQISSNDAASLRNTIIDSGTHITRLPATVYSELRSVFNEFMAKFPVAPRFGKMDTCYNLAGYDLSSVVPSMILHFDNSVDLNLDHDSVVLSESESQVCLAFAEDTETIIGNHQQRNVNVLYDIIDKKVGFSRGTCGS